MSEELRREDVTVRYLEFPIDEMQQRLRNAQHLIAQKGLRGLMLTAEANYYYFTGYRPHTSWSTFTRPVYLFIPREGDAVLLVQVFAVPEACSRSAVVDVRGFDEVATNPTTLVVAILREKGMAKGPVGCELGYEQRLGISYEAFEDVRSACQDADFVDAAEILWELRMVKLPSEIDCLRTANQITSSALDACLRDVHEGMSEREISRRMLELMVEKGADEPGFVIVCSGTGEYQRTSARATDRVLRKGDMLWLDVGVRQKGYWTDFCRAGVVGVPTNEQRRLQTLVHEATMAACQEVRPGAAVADIARVCGAQMEARGLRITFECGRVGHGIGLMSTEPPSVTGHDRMILKAGMTINLEPGVVHGSGVFVVEEDLLVTEAGCEVLSGASRDLYMIATL